MKKCKRYCGCRGVLIKKFKNGWKHIRITKHCNMASPSEQKGSIIKDRKWWQIV